jgi:hypothetical protein
MVKVLSSNPRTARKKNTGENESWLFKNNFI